MEEYIMISDYMNDDKYRWSFNKLAVSTFEDWYKNKFLIANIFVIHIKTRRRLLQMCQLIRWI